MYFLNIFKRIIGKIRSPLGYIITGISLFGTSLGIYSYYKISDEVSAIEKSILKIDGSYKWKKNDIEILLGKKNYQNFGCPGPACFSVLVGKPYKRKDVIYLEISLKYDPAGFQETNDGTLYNQASVDLYTGGDKNGSVAFNISKFSGKESHIDANVPLTKNSLLLVCTGQKDFIFIIKDSSINNLMMSVWSKKGTFPISPDPFAEPQDCTFVKSFLGSYVSPFDTKDFMGSPRIVLVPVKKLDS